MGQIKKLKRYSTGLFICHRTRLEKADAVVRALLQQLNDKTLSRLQTLNSIDRLLLVQFNYRYM